MAQSEVDELRSLASRLRQSAANDEDPHVRDVLARLHETAIKFAEAWSGSSLGYHATVYYENFATPPQGAHFSSEWGGKPGALGEGTTGRWMEYRFEDVLKRIYADAGDQDLDDIEAKAAEARREADSAKAVATSILSVYLSQRDDTYLANLRDDIQKSEALTVRQAIAVQLPRGTIMSRDSRALTGGVGPAPHQQVLAAVTSIKSAFDTCSELARLLDRTGDHIERASALGFSTRSRQGGSVFIGHGHSPLWRELKDFIHERLKLPWDEFNRVPVAGTTNIERLLSKDPSHNIVEFAHSLLVAITTPPSNRSATEGGDAGGQTLSSGRLQREQSAAK
jgi:hypothetical protein